MNMARYEQETIIGLSEKNNYPNKSEEYMANQVFYQIFFG